MLLKNGISQILPKISKLNFTKHPNLTGLPRISRQPCLLFNIKIYRFVKIVWNGRSVLFSLLNALGQKVFYLTV